MAIEGFDYKTFGEELSAQASELLPNGFNDFQKNYVLNTIKNFSTLSGEAIYNDEKLSFNADQAMLITQIIAEWSFHKSIDIIKSGILPDYWDSVMQKIAFTIFEIAKQAIIQQVSQDEILKVVEHHVAKTYSKAIEELKQRKVIDEQTCEAALGQSNIDEMMHKMQSEQEITQATQGIPSEDNSSTKILKLASVALLLRQVTQDKVQTILNKFNPQDAQMIIQYMQMPDLETKVDINIAMKCLNEIKTNLPEPKYISFDKILSRMDAIFKKVPKEKLDRITSKERSNIKEFIQKAQDGETTQIPSKIANIIAQHIEESVS